MKFPDAVTILRPQDADEYGNPGTSWDDPAEIPAQAFITYGVRSSLGHAFATASGMFPPHTDIRPGDRLLWDGATFTVEAPHPVRSPSKTVLITAGLSKVEG